MKKLFAISIFISFIQIYGQNDENINSIEIEPESISFYLISDYCRKIESWNDKTACSRDEIQKRFHRKLFYIRNKTTKKFKKGKYIISYNFIMDKQGTLSDINITTDNDELKSELKYILESLVSGFRIVDENGTVRKRNWRFSIPFQINSVK